MNKSYEMWPFELPQGGGEAKTLTPKQCIIIDAGLESIKVCEHLLSVMSEIHISRQEPVKFKNFIWYFYYLGNLSNLSVSILTLTTICIMYYKQHQP